MRKRPATLALLALALAACSTAPGRARNANTVDPAAGSDGVGGVSAEAAPSPLPGAWPVNGPDGPGPSGPPAAIVPDVRDMSFALAVRRLWATGIDFDLVHAQTSEQPRWSVLVQVPPPGSDTPDSGEVNLVLAMPPAMGDGAYTMVRCRPSPAHLANPYCVGKLLKY